MAGWKEVVGSSGTARSIAEILAKNGALLPAVKDVILAVKSALYME